MLLAIRKFKVTGNKLQRFPLQFSSILTKLILTVLDVGTCVINYGSRISAGEMAIKKLD